jgi:asparagine synthase (glutamine-hydrolysing)
MCGLSGSAVPPGRGRRVDPKLVERMSAALTHRGPDDSGLVVDGCVALANRRLSIIDIPGGHQPMTSVDGRHTVTFNGEIYNAQEIRRELEQRGHRYRTRCDTEALLHLYSEEGTDLVLHLRGCFAFALWDHETRRLLLGRDPLGVKPLYFVHDRDGSIHFASEIKALIAAGIVHPELNAAALPGYLANRATYGEQTLFAGVRRLPAGHVLVWHDGDVDMRRYWDVPEGHAESWPDGDAIARWSELFRESVRLRLIADVPIGVLLSGGIDSSAIAAAVAELSDEPVRTFSVGFSERASDELPNAAAVARYLRSSHREVVVTPEAFAAALPRLTAHNDEPLGHPASVPLYFVSELAAHDVKAVLSGEGADETLAGYFRYRMTMHNIAVGHLYEQLTRDSWRRAFARRIRSRRLSRTFLALPADERSLYFENFAVFGSRAQRELLTAEAAARTAEDDPYAEALLRFDARPHTDLLGRMLYTDVKTYLDGLLMKQDKMSMAASLEARVPFLDQKLVELTAKLPSHLKVHRGWTTKYVLRRSMEGALPTAVLRRRKLGFPVPIDVWFRRELGPALDDLLLGERARRRGLFEPEYVTRLVREHQAGARHGDRLWALLSFELWARCFLDGEQPEPHQPLLAAHAR